MKLIKSLKENIKSIHKLDSIDNAETINEKNYHDVLSLLEGE